MRYLRLFENNNTIEDIKDICIDVEDIGLSIHIVNCFPTHTGTWDGINTWGFITHGYKYDMESFYSLIIEKKGYKDINYKDIQEVIERLKDYLGYKLVADYIKVGGINWFNCKDVVFSDSTSQHLTLTSLFDKVFIKNIKAYKVLFNV